MATRVNDASNRCVRTGVLLFGGSTSNKRLRAERGETLSQKTAIDAARIASSPPSLEAEFHAELHDARGARLRLDAAERAGAQIGAWIAPVEMVQEVERLRPQLKTVARTEGDVSRKGQIDAPEGRADQRVPD